MAAAVIVVDMQNGFMTPGGTLYCGDGAREIIAPLRARAEREKAAGASLFFTQDTHAPDDAEFEMFPPHCVAGSGEEEIIPELADLAAGARIVRKRRYSAFFDTDLAAQLRELQPEEVVVMGGLHRHLRAAHRFRTAQPGLQGGGAGRLRRQLRPGAARVGPRAHGEDPRGPHHQPRLKQRAARPAATVRAERGDAGGGERRRLLPAHREHPRRRRARSRGGGGSVRAPGRPAVRHAGGARPAAGGPGRGRGGLEPGGRELVGAEGGGSPGARPVPPVLPLRNRAAGNAQQRHRLGYCGG